MDLVPHMVTYTQTGMYKQTQRQIDTSKDRHTSRQRYTHTDKHIDRDTLTFTDTCEHIHTSSGQKFCVVCSK